MPATVPPPCPEGDDTESDQRHGPESERRRWIWRGGAIVAAFAGGVLVWLSQQSGPALQTKDDVPLVKAAELPVKVRPEDPGGMHVAHRDKLIYQRFEDDEAPPVVERLLSAPEEPLPPPLSEPESSPAEGIATTEDAPPSEFMPAPPEEEVLAPPTEPFLQEAAPGIPPPDTLPSETPLETPQKVEVPSEPSSVAMAPPRPRPTAPPPPPPSSGPRAGLSAEARAAQALLMGAEAGGYALQLGSVRSHQEANVEWERLKSDHADILGGLRPTVLKADLGQRGVYYRLQAGPVTSQKFARQLCSSLADRKVACIVVQH